MATQSPCDASLPGRAPCRQNLRQEPGAVVPLAGICAGGRPQGRSLPRHPARRPPARPGPSHRKTGLSIVRSLDCTERHPRSLNVKQQPR
jgi:hypothetical protein